MSEKTLGEVMDTLNDEQRVAVGAILDAELEDAYADAQGAYDDDYDDYDDDYDDYDDYDDDDYEDYEEGDDMKHNVFDADTQSGNFLSHSEQLELEHSILDDAQRYGSLKDAIKEYVDNGYLEHAITNADGSTQGYGMANVDYLFPDPKSLNNPPGFIQRKNDWVAKVMNATHHTPFARIKSLFADITMEEARAKGYLKGKQKKEEVFTLLKRTTDPQTIYKLQKMDRDDINDITDFDVVAWLRNEMRMMLDEEIARAILIGDGRSTAAEDHISADHIRPILTDDDLYSIKVNVEVGSSASESEKAKAFIRSAIKSRKDYRGTGNPTLYTTEDVLADMLLIEDGIGHLMYQNQAALATTMRVNDIVTVPPMEGCKDANGNKALGIIVNLQDYNVGADKGGAINMFDDFDIQYNQQRYLIETRCSGALIVPKSAMVFSEKVTTSSTSTPSGN